MVQFTKGKSNTDLIKREVFDENELVRKIRRRQFDNAEKYKGEVQ